MNDPGSGCLGVIPLGPTQSSFGTDEQTEVIDAARAQLPAHIAQALIAVVVGDQKRKADRFGKKNGPGSGLGHARNQTAAALFGGFGGDPLEPAGSDPASFDPFGQNRDERRETEGCPSGQGLLESRRSDLRLIKRDADRRFTPLLHDLANPHAGSVGTGFEFASQTSTVTYHRPDLFSLTNPANPYQMVTFVGLEGHAQARFGIRGPVGPENAVQFAHDRSAVTATQPPAPSVTSASKPWARSRSRIESLSVSCNPEASNTPPEAVASARAWICC